jgi:hypothetical protein
MPEWLKEKNCPHKKKYMAGKRIQPRNLTGRKLYMVDKFSRLLSARLKPASFASGYSAPNITIGMSIGGALTPAGSFAQHSTHQGRFRGLDRFLARTSITICTSLNYPVHSAASKLTTPTCRQRPRPHL